MQAHSISESRASIRFGVQDLLLLYDHDTLHLEWKTRYALRFLPYSRPGFYSGAKETEAEALDNFEHVL
jgi:hypothetical protein